MSDPTPLLSSTRPIRPELAAVVGRLQPGQRIRITQTVRINCRRSWKTTVEGVFRDVNFLATGLATDRVPEDDIVVVTVVKVQDISSEDFVERDLMLIKVRVSQSQRGEVNALLDMFRARVVDISHESMMLEISGRENKIEAFIDLMRPYGIVELARTGRIALVRGEPGKGDVL